MKGRFSSAMKPLPDKPRQENTLNRTVRSSFLVFSLTCLASTLNTVVDSVIIGAFMNSTMLAAFNAAICFSIFIEMVSGALSSGVQIACSQAAGFGKIKDANSYFSSAIAASAGISALIIAVIRLLPDAAVFICGFSSSDEALKATLIEYLNVYAFGIPAIIFTVILVNILRIDSDGRASIISLVSSIIINVIGDLTVVFLGGGIQGIAITTAISCWVAFAVLAISFRRDQTLFSFSLQSVSPRPLAEVLRCGSSYVVQRMTAVIRNPIINHFVLQTGGIPAMAMWATVNAVSSMLYSVSKGVKDTSMTLTGIVYGKDDPVELQVVIKRILKLALISGSTATLIGLTFARPIAGLYLSTADPAYEMAVTGLRIGAFDVVTGSLLMVFIGYYLGRKKVGLSTLLNFLDALTPLILFFILLPSAGVYAVVLCYPLSRCAVMGMTALYARLIKKSPGLSLKDLLMLPDDYGCTENDRLDFELTHSSQAPGFENAIESFCLQHGIPPVNSVAAAFCAGLLSEAISGRYISRENSSCYVRITVYVKNEAVTLRLEDNCPKYNPEQWFDSAQAEARLGEPKLKLLENAFKSADYVHLMNLNCLTIHL